MTGARWFSRSGRTSYDFLRFSPRMRGHSVSLGHSGSPIHRKSRRCLLSHVISCVQSQLIALVIGHS
ncbi:unnamed protein product [Staurois parvus]|uniref:Uncharacterized protein n=1 Tax=Staurois parvus TaxID=386267 RepID=A0ABN9E875_9NEOB|nr:unnamed protein product [Staurois parvus]